MRNSQLRAGGVEVVLMEIAEGLRKLIENPDLSSKIKEVYALNEAEMKAVEEARETLTNADKLRSELAKEGKKYADLQNQIEKKNALQKANEKLLETIQKERDINAEKMAEINKGLLDLKALSKAVDERGAKLDLREKKLQEGYDDLNKQRAEIKSALDKSKMILGGLG